LIFTIQSSNLLPLLIFLNSIFLVLPIKLLLKFNIPAAYVINILSITFFNVLTIFVIVYIKNKIYLMIISLLLFLISYVSLVFSSLILVHFVSLLFILIIIVFISFNALLVFLMIIFYIVKIILTDSNLQIFILLHLLKFYDLSHYPIYFIFAGMY